MESLEELLLRVAPDLNPSIPYEQKLSFAGFWTTHAIKYADSAKQIAEACGFPLGDACTIWKAAGGGAATQMSYFISPQAQNVVRAAMFYVIDDEDNGVGVGVFFSKSKAVTADHNLSVDQVPGTKVLVKLPGDAFHAESATKSQQPADADAVIGDRTTALLSDRCRCSAELQEQLTLTVAARHPEMDFALLQCDVDHAFLPTYCEALEQLADAELVLAGYCIGIESDVPMFSRRLGFTKADTISLSSDSKYLFYHCTTFGGDSGAALILKGGCLVGVHQETINVLRDRLQRVQGNKDKCTEAIDAIMNRGITQGFCALLSSVFSV